MPYHETLGRPTTKKPDGTLALMLKRPVLKSVPEAPSDPSTAIGARGFTPVMSERAVYVPQECKRL